MSDGSTNAKRRGAARRLTQSTSGLVASFLYRNCGEQHLHRYLAEYEFRYNNREALGYNDSDRSLAALKGIIGKRLTYGWPDEAARS